MLAQKPCAMENLSWLCIRSKIACSATCMASLVNVSRSVDGSTAMPALAARWSSTHMMHKHDDAVSSGAIRKEKQAEKKSFKCRDAGTHLGTEAGKVLERFRNSVLRMLKLILILA